MFKMKKLKYKKTIIIIFLFFIFLILLYFFRSKNYTINYNFESYEISESYDKKNNLYQFLINVDNNNYIVKIEHKYIYKKKLINEIEIKKDDNTVCIIPQSKKINFYPLCIQNNELISYHQINNKELIPKKYYHEIKPLNNEYNKININYLNDKKYFIWNYKGFYVINNKNKKTINIFEDDIYSIPIAYKSEKNILIADYSSKYKFNKFYIIQAKNNKIKEIITNKELSFESYILGKFKDKIYMMDKKNKKEYEINTKKLTINDITKNNKGKVFNNGTWEDISTTKLSNQEYSFTNPNLFDYKIINNRLYLMDGEYKTLVSNFEIKDIIDIHKDTVYYLVDDKLYTFNPLDGEILIMTYFEWNFNYKNMIYIF